jgi:hypothetical protein
MLTVTQHLAHDRLPLLSMEPETTKNDQDFSFRCPSDSYACKSRSRAFLNLSESALSMRRCISFAVSRSPLDCLNSTFSRIARSATTSAISASARAPATAASAAPPFALLNPCPYGLGTKVQFDHRLFFPNALKDAVSVFSNSSRSLTKARLERRSLCFFK